VSAGRIDGLYREKERTAKKNGQTPEATGSSRVSRFGDQIHFVQPRAGRAHCAIVVSNHTAAEDLSPLRLLTADPSTRRSSPRARQYTKKTRNAAKNSNNFFTHGTPHVLPARTVSILILSLFGAIIAARLEIPRSKSP
jgi:hypothetical protein